jgi:hypothetical protein
MSNNSLTIIIVDKTGLLKTLHVKEFNTDDLYKKCGFKKSDDFIQQTEWGVKIPSEKDKIYIRVFAKTTGRANNENKYDFPPPIDNKLFFGNCAIVAQIRDTPTTFKHIELTIPLWDKIYEKLFGGFEDLSASAKEDEEEEDELKNVPSDKKTKDGYLKDGFVVDSSDTDETEQSDSNEDSSEPNEEVLNEDGANVEIDIGSELSEDGYDYSDDEK